MSRSLKRLFFILLTGCSGSGLQTVSQYTPMNKTAAQALVNTAVSMCNASSSGTIIGSAPSTIQIGTSATPANHTYILNGGTTAISGGVGSIWITGMGGVSYMGNFSGNVTVCGPDVTTITGNGSSANANIHVVNGNVGSIDGFSGDVAIKNGKFNGVASAFFGNIAWEFGGETEGRTYTGP